MTVAGFCKMAAARRCMYLVVVFIVISSVNCWIPRIMNGRPVGGKLRPPVAPPDVTLPPEQWFHLQRLDHFDGSNERIWKQRYFVNDTFYKPGGPILLMIGGEGPANPIWMVEGAWVQVYAPKYNAICVQLEHRYYGESHPVLDLSLTNLQYLSSRQALADLAYFIDWFRKEQGLAKNKLVTLGGSYPGSLSAWFRSKYPYMVDGAVATSAPIFAKLDFLEYLSVVTDSLATTGSKCDYEIFNAARTVQDWWSSQKQRDQLYTTFKLCDKIDPNNRLDMAGLFANLAGNFEDVVQYNKDNRAFEGAIGTNITLDTLCNIMNDESRGQAVQRYADVNSLILDTYSQPCLDYKYDKMVDDMKKVAWNSSAGEGGRQWTYQTCAEFGWFQSSDYIKQPFASPTIFPAEYFIQQCEDIYEKAFNATLIGENVDDTNRYYGGRDIPITKVVFPNGSIDPWHAMGVTKDISPDATAIYINGTAHCANMYPGVETDPPQLVAARHTIARLIGQWIA